jgi:hypothetical protein
MYGDELYEQSDYEGGEYEIEYGAEVKAYERVHAGRPDVIVGKLFQGGEPAGMSLEAIHKKLFKNMSGEERFKQSVNFYINLLREKLKISEATENRLMDCDNFPNIKYKNSICYILGYYVLNQDQIDKARFNNIIENVVPDLGENIRPEDVLRYARFWQGVKK